MNLVINVSADGLAPNGAWTSAAPVLVIKVRHVFFYSQGTTNGQSVLVLLWSSSSWKCSPKKTTVHFIDDLHTLNNDGHLEENNNMGRIYPQELKLNQENKNSGHSSRMLKTLVPVFSLCFCLIKSLIGGESWKSRNIAGSRPNSQDFTRTSQVLGHLQPQCWW